MNETTHPKTILIIDDEEIIRQSLCDQLEDLGYRVLTAEDGRAGMELIERERPELILTDLRMPEMGGLEVIKRSKELASNIPIIVISGAGRIDDAVEALRRGAYDYLTKPINDLDMLQHTVSRALENASLQSEIRAYQEHLETLVRERTTALAISREKQVISERLVSIGTLAAGLAHEINNPLGAILNGAELALMADHDPDHERIYRDALEETVRQARRCGKIVHGILKFCRDEPTEKMDIDVVELVGRACRLTQPYARSRGATENRRIPSAPACGAHSISCADD